MHPTTAAIQPRSQAARRLLLPTNRRAEIKQTVRKLDGKLRTVVREGGFSRFSLLCSVVGREKGAALLAALDAPPSFRTVCKISDEAPFARNSGTFERERAIELRW